MTKEQYRQKHERLQAKYLKTESLDAKDSTEHSIEKLIMSYFGIKSFDDFDDAGGIFYGEKKFIKEIYG